MIASMFQGDGGPQSVVGEERHGHLPMGLTPAMKEGSQGPTMSDLQFMLHNEQKQHEDMYKYAHGHNGQ